jgi:hypothetical protein
MVVKNNNKKKYKFAYKNIIEIEGTRQKIWGVISGIKA